MSETQTAAPTGPQFRAVRHVTLPVFSFKGTRGAPRYYRIDSPMYLGKKIDDQKEAAHLLRVTDLTTGQLGLIVVPTVMRKELLENYKGDAYVGKCFELRVWRMAGARYNHVGIVEVEMEGNVPTPSAASTIPAGQLEGDEADPDDEEGDPDGEGVVPEADAIDADEPEAATATRNRSRAAKKTTKRRR